MKGQRGIITGRRQESGGAVPALVGPFPTADLAASRHLDRQGHARNRRVAGPANGALASWPWAIAGFRATGELAR